MVESKPWNWKMVQDAKEDYWRAPAPEAYYLAHRWQSQARKSIFDLGTGLGRYAVFFSKLGFDVSALDLSEESIKRAREWAASEGLKIDFKTGDMIALPYADDSFDCIMCVNFISHQDTAGVKKALSEVRRVLKPGGEIYFTLCSKLTWTKRCSDWPKVDENTKLKMDKGPEYKVPHFCADTRLLPALTKGFKIIQMEHAQHYWPANSSEEVYTSVNKQLGLTHGGWHYHILMRKNER